VVRLQQFKAAKLKQPKGGQSVTVNYSKLEGRIVERFGNRKNFAAALGISTNSMSRKLRGKQAFSRKDILKSAELLGIAVDELGEYFSTLLMLKDRYRKDIEIKIGLETEYYKSIFDDCLDFWRPYPIDYLILGQHFIPEETGAATSPSSRPTDDKSILTLYTDTVIEAMNTGLITYVAHPDLMNYVGTDTDFYLSECRRLISEAVRLGIPLEYNLLGMTLGRSYPKDLFWRTVSEYNVKTVIGCDSHEPHRVADKNEIERAEGYLHSLGIYPLDEIELVKPKF
jgi:histidinol-phosphatase (PHP family)